MINSMASHDWKGDKSPVHDRVKELEQEVAELRRIRANDALDAERYRWLRDSGLVYLHEGLDDSGWYPYYDTDVDYAADAAIKEATK